MFFLKDFSGKMSDLWSFKPPSQMKEKKDQRSKDLKSIDPAKHEYFRKERERKE